MKDLGSLGFLPLYGP